MIYSGISKLNCGSILYYTSLEYAQRRKELDKEIALY